jgi:peroxiredoxin
MVRWSCPENRQENAMIKVGDRLPEATLNELTVEYTQGCPTGPEAYKVSDLTRGKRIVIFGLPGAFTRTCSGKPCPATSTWPARSRRRR